MARDALPRQKEPHAVLEMSGIKDRTRLLPNHPVVLLEPLGAVICACIILLINPVCFPLELYHKFQ